jgi:hypothetical protein
MMDAILDITGIITVREEAVPILQVVLKAAVTNTMVIPTPIVQEELVIPLLPILLLFQNQVVAREQLLALELIAERIVQNLTLQELTSL